MSRNPVRQDKTCLNCRAVVQQRYCPNCGQENTETRKTFYHLFVHFFEDLTHYENAFWKTIRNLLARPGALTKVYLSGKRMSYLAPIRLYIFISFVTFFVLSILPDSSFDDNIKLVDKPKSGLQYEIDEPDKIDKLVNDSIMAQDSITLKEKKYGDRILDMTEREVDSLQRSLNKDDHMPNFVYKFYKKAFHIQKNNSKEEIKEKFTESLWRNIPKALFLYMPIFAFVLWVFQNKRRWYYFDHGIFTLHYFSFLLLIYLIAGLIGCVLGWIDGWIGKIINIVIRLGLFSYSFYYFFPAHHRFYEETRLVSLIKGIVIFFINMMLGLVLITALMLYSFLNIH